jgi:ABC-2 type transport system permease protein
MRTCRSNGVRYTAFLIPGLVMMSVLQNAFANSSSSLIQSKVTGSVVFVLLPPISYRRVLSRLRRRGDVARSDGRARRAAGDRPGSRRLTFVAPGGFWPLPFSAAAIMGSLGMIAGIWADKFDQLAGFQNFLIMPLTMLSGVFYSIHSLPAFWQRCRISIPFST